MFSHIFSLLRLLKMYCVILVVFFTFQVTVEKCLSLGTLLLHIMT